VPNFQRGRVESRHMASVGERICGPGAAAGALLRKASVHTFENAPSASANGEDERTQEEGKGIRTPTWPWCLTCFAGAAKQVGTWLALGSEFDGPDAALGRRAKMTRLVL